ncbi:cold shock domain-containing protein [Vibrio crassostreae]|uniref:cold shock domain-containing protein n=1 Tax=Vibrio crassostreae TaxID=246167 RepID=UPI0006372470|nr:cold shock domain-containing protein [Vibrio crassostreae]TCT50306.1 putative cold-shock DNA-binding protein [Vibrio crassostreae]TCT65117.1 putative cold-shock DNA-binding protein [Vibrio crassostreae]TCT75246.1 putative cold-shock DNA-binding protein [Vibrio crassostreae]TCT94329.1 putative cold-shock DNA-binding protein [Vibrio crassostreae]CAK1747938.1 Cold shock protein [Vibrio crassostreae]
MNGKIVRWVDEKGFGFINSDELEGDVFVHISKFTDGYRRPQIGDEVEFQLSNSGSKLSASSAQLVGIETSQSNPLSIILSALFVGLIGAGLYLLVLEPKLNPAYENMGFSCQGKTHCSEMLSCDEAKFYLANCPNVKIDGDRDGIPCESQFCSHY